MVFNLVLRLVLVGLGVGRFLVGAVGLAVGVSAIPVAHGPLVAVGGLVRGVSVVGLSVGISAIPKHGPLVPVCRFVLLVGLLGLVLVHRLVLVLVGGLVVILFIAVPVVMLLVGRLLIFHLVLRFVLVGLGVGDVLLL